MSLATTTKKQIHSKYKLNYIVIFTPNVYTIFRLAFNNMYAKKWYMTSFILPCAYLILIILIYVFKSKRQNVIFLLHKATAERFLYLSSAWLGLVSKGLRTNTHQLFLNSHISTNIPKYYWINSLTIFEYCSTNISTYFNYSCIWSLSGVYQTTNVKIRSGNTINCTKLSTIHLIYIDIYQIFRIIVLSLEKLKIFSYFIRQKSFVAHFTLPRATTLSMNIIPTIFQ